MRANDAEKEETARVTTFEIGDAKPREDGQPDWHAVWPVLVDGVEIAEIMERENGYRLRKAGVWMAQERPFRSAAADDARNEFLDWNCIISHPASNTRYEETEINGVTWGRVVVEGMTVYGPEAGTEGARAEYDRRYHEATKGL